MTPASDAMDERIHFDPDRDDGPAPSPCINICRISEQTGWCEGCQRRLEEIGGWRSRNEAERRDIWRRILARRGGAPA